MGTNRNALWWGLAFIVIGVVLILRNADVWPDRLSIWPPILILIGLRMAVPRRGRPVRWDHLFVPLLLVALGGYFLLRDFDVIGAEVSAWPVALIVLGVAILLGMVGSRQSPAETVTRTIAAEAATSARIVVEHGGGRLRLGALPTGDGALLRGTFGGGVDDRIRRSDRHLDVRLRGHGGSSWSRLGSGGRTWDFELSPEIALDLELHWGAGHATVDLEALLVTDFRLETGASETNVTVPGAASSRISISAGAARVRVRVPEDVAARIRSDTGLASVEVDAARFPRSGGAYESLDYPVATVRSDISIEGGVASFSVT